MMETHSNGFKAWKVAVFIIVCNTLFLKSSDCGRYSSLPCLEQSKFMVCELFLCVYLFQ